MMLSHNPRVKRTVWNWGGLRNGLWTFQQ